MPGKLDWLLFSHPQKSAVQISMRARGHFSLYIINENIPYQVVCFCCVFTVQLVNPVVLSL